MLYSVVLVSAIQQSESAICIHVCMLTRFSCVPLFATLWTVARQALLSMRFSRREHWSGLPCLSSGDLPNLGIEPTSLRSPALAGGFFITSATWEAPYIYIYALFLRFTSHLVHHRAMRRVLCAVQLVLISYLFYT